MIYLLILTKDWKKNLAVWYSEGRYSFRSQVSEQEERDVLKRILKQSTYNLKSYTNYVLYVFYDFCHTYFSKLIPKNLCQCATWFLKEP